jgi:hypothetical protein
MVRPKPLLDIFASDNFARPFQQNAEELDWLLLKPDPDAMLSQFAPSDIQFEDTEPMGRLLLLGIDHRKWVEK